MAKGYAVTVQYLKAGKYWHPAGPTRAVEAGSLAAAAAKAARLALRDLRLAKAGRVSSLSIKVEQTTSGRRLPAPEPSPNGKVPAPAPAESALGA